MVFQLIYLLLNYTFVDLNLDASYINVQHLIEVYFQGNICYYV